MSIDKMTALSSIMTTVKSVCEERDELKERLNKAETVIHGIGEVAGMLDVVGAAVPDKLVSLAQTCRDKLLNLAGDYWAAVEDE